MSNIVARLESHIRVSDDCWLWNGYLRTDGYAVMTVKDAAGRPGTRYVHRLMYEAKVGPIPEGMQLDHLCRVRHCMNPAHLEPVTPTENYLRGAGVPARNARKTHCKHGHVFDEANTHIRPRGGRTCRTCERAKVRRHRAQKKAAA